MLTYYISGSNIFDIRIAEKCSGSLVLKLQNMSTLVNQSSSLSNYEYDKYQSLLSFTASIVSASVGDQYRAELVGANKSVWHGSFQVFASQSLDKTVYKNQLPIEEVYVSNLSDNEYIILD